MHVHFNLTDREIKSLIRNGKVKFAGNKKLRIYGLLSCSSGKQMKRDNRVFFSTIEEAVQLGYRPCGKCMKKAYIQWKQLTSLI